MSPFFWEDMPIMDDLQIRRIFSEEHEILVDLPNDPDDENDEFGRWSYRIVKHGEQYKIAEVFYNKHRDISGWADVSDNCLIRETYEELKGTYDLIKHAFEKPVLVVIEGDKLKEVIEGDPSNASNSSSLTNSLLTVWYNASNRLRLLLSDAAYQTWIAPIIPSAEGNQLILNCPNEFVKDWVTSRYKKDIMEIVQSIEPSVEGIIIRGGGGNKGTGSVL